MERHCLRRHPELLTEGARERLMRAISRRQGDGENIRCTRRQRARGLAETTAAGVSHKRTPGCPGKRTREMVSRYTGRVGNSP